MEYKIELHCHSKEVSGCSTIPGAELVHLFKEAGYAAIHITDHFTADFFKNHEFNDYFKGYNAALEESEKYGLKVLLGAEYRFSYSSNDYLLFGVTPEFLEGAREYFDKTTADFHEYCQKNNVLFYQAHPFRNGIKRADIGTVDGIEIYNMHPDHNSRNNMAREYASSLGYNGISGSDAHQPYMVGRGGIITNTLPKTSAELRDIIANKKYSLYHVKWH